MNDLGEKLLQEWFDTYKTSGVNVQKRVTKARLAFVNEALLHFSFDDLSLLLKYLRVSKDDYARFMRGENPSKKPYLKLASIFRIHKLSDKIERAKEWKDTLIEPIESEDVYNPFTITFEGDE